jgi:hypothetical protein
LGVFLRFIQPCSPGLAKSVPAGDDWQHEIKSPERASPPLVAAGRIGLLQLHR